MELNTVVRIHQTGLQKKRKIQHTKDTRRVEEE
jgi:hypothetical protein